MDSNSLMQKNGYQVKGKIVEAKMANFVTLTRIQEMPLSIVLLKVITQVIGKLLADGA